MNNFYYTIFLLQTIYCIILFSIQVLLTRYIILRLYEIKEQNSKMRKRFLLFLFLRCTRAIVQCAPIIIGRCTRCTLQNCLNIIYKYILFDFNIMKNRLQQATGIGWRQILQRVIRHPNFFPTDPLLYCTLVQIKGLYCICDPDRVLWLESQINKQN